MLCICHAVVRSRVCMAGGSRRCKHLEEHKTFHYHHRHTTHNLATECSDRCTMFIVFWGPLAATYRLKWWALAAFFPSMLVMGLGLGLDKTPGQPSEAAYLAGAIASASLLITFGCWVWWALWWDLESVYRIAPWKQQQDDQKGAKGVLCPFTGTWLMASHQHHQPASGLRPSYRCGSCGTLVHDTYFHNRDWEMSFPGRPPTTTNHTRMYCTL